MPTAASPPSAAAAPGDAPSWSARLRRPFAPPPATRRIERDLPLEGLRGLCALAVFYAHLFLPGPFVDPTWVPPAAFMRLDLGQGAVLMFFVLSGYVIGLVTREPADGPGTRRYIRHRIARLVPINTVAVLLSWLLLAHSEPRDVIGSLFFLQNEVPYPVLGSFAVLENNGNLWSLNYEAVYYLAFIAVWWLAPSARVLFGGLALCVIAYSLGAPLPEIFARYACGGLYWFAGLAVAWWTEPSDAASRRTEWPAAALIFFAMWAAGPVRAFLYDWSLYNWLWVKSTSPHRLDFLLVSLWALLAVTDRAPRLRAALAYACFALLGAALATRAFSGTWATADGLTLAATLGAIALHRRAFPLTVLRWLAPTGAISFALYMIAAPLQAGQRRILPEFSGSVFTFSVRALAYIVLAFTASWLLEKRLAPPLTRLLRGREKRAVATVANSSRS